MFFEFREYAAKIVENSNALAETLQQEDVDVVKRGTDNHLLLVDVTKYGLNSRQAEAALRACNITLNRNALPFDQNGPWYTSGLRLGTAAVTTLGMGEHEMTKIAKTIKAVLEKTMPGQVAAGDRQGQVSKAKYYTDSQVANAAQELVADLLNQYPLYPEIDHNLLESAISASNISA